MRKMESAPMLSPLLGCGPGWGDPGGLFCVVDMWGHNWAFLVLGFIVVVDFWGCTVALMSGSSWWSWLEVLDNSEQQVYQEMHCCSDSCELESWVFLVPAPSQGEPLQDSSRRKLMLFFLRGPQPSIQFCFWFCFQMGSHYVAKACLELTV